MTRRSIHERQKPYGKKEYRNWVSFSAALRGACPAAGICERRNRVGAACLRVITIERNSKGARRARKDRARGTALSGP
jgi:hypothetical protein